MRIQRCAVLFLFAIAVVVSAGFVATGYSGAIASIANTATGVPPTPSSQALERAARAVRFEANRGQAPDGVRYVARGSGRALAFDDDGFALRSGDRIVRIGFAAAGARPEATLDDVAPGVSNYLLGTDAHRWVTGVERFAALRYRDVAPGVDAHFYAAGSGDELEFDFLVAPGADPRAIALQVEGAESLAVGASGGLRIEAGGEQTELRAPVTYQAIDGRRTAVESTFVLRGDGHVGFDVGEYDSTRELVIDPVLVYSTFLGGAGSAGTFGDFGYGVSSDAAGNAFLVGQTDSATFPATPGSYQSVCAGPVCADGFVTKLDPSGALLFSTYIGGPLSDGLQAVEVSETTGVIHFVGAGSEGFPVTAGAFQSVNAGVGDVVVGALDSSGTTLLASTFVGGSASEGSVDLAIDAAGFMYVTGQTLSCDLPTTAGSFQAVDPMCGLFDAFVAAISPDATTAAYVTYLGGSSGSDVGAGIDVDAFGSAYVVGFAGATDFPTTPGSFQPTWPGGFNSAWVSKLLPDGSGLAYSTFLGGSDSDDASDVVVDAAGNAYVVGATLSTDFPTVSAVQAANGGSGDIFVSILDPTGSSLLSSTYLGGNGNDGATGVQLESPGVVWFTGTTRSTNFPTADPVQAAAAGGGDAIVVRLDTTTPALTFSTYLGGVANDTGADLALVADGVVGTGFTSSVDFPTVDPLQAAFGGGIRDAYAFAISTRDGTGDIVATASAPRRLNPRSRGVIPVAVLSSPSFDATTIDPASASFGPSGAPIAHRGHIDDVDGDGDDDLQLHFRTRYTGIACGDTEATLIATTLDGGAVVTATVAFRTVGCR